MTSPAFVVLSVALVCSTFGIASEQADHDSTHEMNQEPSQRIFNLNHTDIRMKTARTNVDNYRLSKEYISYSKQNKFDEIYDESDDFRERNVNSKSVIGEQVRQYRKENYVKRFSGKKRVKRDDDDSKCEAFKLIRNNNEGKMTHPHKKGSLNYYNNTDCVFPIKANEGEVIKLTFVDVFHIEEHAKCEYDYLEIRDGSQGYANLLGKFCGETFPSQIRSSGPNLWLKFHSDNTIEYEGFHIQVKFEMSPDSHSIPDSCNITLKEAWGNIDSKKIPDDCKLRSKNQALDVIWSIFTEENRKIYLNFTSYTLVKPNECEENLVQVFGSILEFDAKLAHYCGSVANSVTTKDGDSPYGKEKGNIMYIRMYTSKIASESNFKATYTSFKTIDPSKDEECDKDEEFDCEDNTCIPKELMCDKTANCRLKADEDQELCENETESVISKPHILVILVIFSLILSGMSFVFLFKCIRKLYQDHKIIKEHIKQSCEDRLDNLTDSRFTLDPKKLQRDSIPRERASLERENHTNEMFKQQRNFTQRKPSSIDSDYIQETQIDEEPWRREVDSVPIEAQDIKIERNGRTRRSDLSKKEESIRSKRESEERKERKEIRDVSVGVPDTKESGCQTRESLFQEPAPSSDGSGSNGRGFSTFGYSGATIARPSPAPTTNTAQITIELLKQVPPHQESKPQKKISDRRPMSTETTRSAPDVIIVSKPIG